MSSVSPLSPNVSIVSISAAFPFLNLWQKSSIQRFNLFPLKCLNKMKRKHLQAKQFLKPSPLDFGCITTMTYK